MKWLVLFLCCIHLQASNNCLAAELSQGPQPLHDWDLTERNWVKGLLREKKRNLSVKLDQLPNFGGHGEWLLDGSTGISISGIKPEVFPRKHLTAEAVVSLDAGEKYGSIIGYAQDNGSYERGWILGYNEGSFLFWVSTGGALIQATSSVPFELGRKYHVAGTFDGSTVRIYVNGQLTGQAKAEGQIVYPEAAYYTIGVYHDQDENFPMKGALHSVRLYDVAIDGSSILKKSNTEEVQPVKFTVRPALQFISPAEAKVTWTSTSEKKMRVIYGKTRKLGTVVEGKKIGDGYSAHLYGLEPDKKYFYKIGELGKGRYSATFEFNTNLNFSSQSIKGPRNEKLAQRATEIILKAGTRNGYCLVIGASDPGLLIELARASNLSVVALESDPETILKARKFLYAAGAQGVRVNIIPVDDLSGKIPLTSCMVNLLISMNREEDDEIKRVLVPGRGRAMFVSESDRIYARPRLEGSGEWSHQYGDVGNSAASEESLSGATGTHDFALQWVGRPGADFGIDRNPRMPAPLATGGRLFHQGMNRLVALDAHNGSILWGIEAPDLRRVNIPRDCGNWCADDESLYVAVKELAWIFNAETGKRLQTLKVFQGGKDQQQYDWGYIGRVSDNLIGSGVRSDAVYTNFWSGKMWYDGKAGAEGTEQVCSDLLFGYSLSGVAAKPSWSYRNGVILNPTISGFGDQVFFVETRNKSILNQTKRRLSGKELWQDQFLVSLDADSGKVLWERPIDTEDGLVTFYLQAKTDSLILTASNTKFHIYTYSTKTGQPLWYKSNDWPDDHHSGHFQHPVITGTKIYLQPNGYDLNTGEILTRNMGKREGCHTYVGAGGALIYRGSSRQISMWDQKTESVSSWSRLRPSCWLNTIPASGMLLVPEGGGGCSCGGWMETSVGFLPRVHLTGGK